MWAVEEAEQLFREFCDVRNLAIANCERTEDGLFLQVPKQPGLDFDLDLTLTNGDEIGICFEGFWADMFPFPKNREKVCSLLNDILSGEAIMTEFSQFGRVVKRTLDHSDGTRLYSHFSGLSLPFILKKTRQIQNTPIKTEETP